MRGSALRTENTVCKVNVKELSTTKATSYEKIVFVADIQIPYESARRYWYKREEPDSQSFCIKYRYFFVVNLILLLFIILAKGR